MSKLNVIKEACVGSFREAVAAEKQGADRVELCDNLHDGGTTPSYGTIQLCAARLKIPVRVMIRPRGGDFYYDDEELQIMLSDISVCRQFGVDGVVFGPLVKSGRHIDYAMLDKLVNASKVSNGHGKPLHVVFHKAFDQVMEPDKEIIRLAREHRIDSVLTSGQKPTACEGSSLIVRFQQLVEGHLKIIAAGSITNDNLNELKTNHLFEIDEFHGKKIVGQL